MNNYVFWFYGFFNFNLNGQFLNFNKKSQKTIPKDSQLMRRYVSFKFIRKCRYEYFIRNLPRVGKWKQFDSSQTSLSASYTQVLKKCYDKWKCIKLNPIWIFMLQKLSILFVSSVPILKYVDSTATTRILTLPAMSSLCLEHVFYSVFKKPHVLYSKRGWKPMRRKGICCRRRGKLFKPKLTFLIEFLKTHPYRWCLRRIYMSEPWWVRCEMSTRKTLIMLFLNLCTNENENWLDSRSGRKRTDEVTWGLRHNNGSDFLAVDKICTEALKFYVSFWLDLKVIFSTSFDFAKTASWREDLIVFLGEDFGSEKLLL